MIKNGDIIFFTGIKGTGMTALAELFRALGAVVVGSDVAEKFYTDEILEEMAIPVYENFDGENVPKSAKLLIYSAAYNPDEHPEILKAVSLGIETLSYPQALGYFSKEHISAGVAGVHGKTTTTAIAGTLIKELKLSCSVLTGSGAANFNGRSTLFAGDKYFIAETCEYRRNFLNFHPSFMIITSIEPDHLDYYKDYNDILGAFVEYGKRISPSGSLIFCADNEGAIEAAKLIATKRDDIKLIPYGITAKGDFKITVQENKPGEQHFLIEKFGNFDFCLKIPGLHNIQNSTAAAALVYVLAEKENLTEGIAKKIAEGFKNFRGTKRRGEIVGVAGGILFMDDYAHHPTAIKTTLRGLRQFYPEKRIIVDFMSHTYSRTESLLEDFADSFSDADIVSLHKIYASAREKKGKITGVDLYKKVDAMHKNVFYHEEIMDAYSKVYNLLKKGDLFLTMGAGDNWRLGQELFRNIYKENYK